MKILLDEVFRGVQRRCCAIGESIRVTLQKVLDASTADR
jgi:hypothetical protein